MEVLKFKKQNKLGNDKVLMIILSPLFIEMFSGQLVLVIFAAKPTVQRERERERVDK